MSQPTSFKTNVNRAKTKRWVEAKSYSYDGDDWGDADEYDEYGGYDDEPAPPSKPTGLRQRGQSVTQATQDYNQAQQATARPSVGDGRPSYGREDGQPHQQPPQGMRSVTSPPPQVNTNLPRPNSFERGDEKRTFSAGGGPPQGMRQPQTQQDTAAPSSFGDLNPRQMQPENRDYSPAHPQSREPPQYPRQIYPEPTRPHSQSPSRPSADYASKKNEQPSSPARDYGALAYPEPPRQPGSGSRTQSMTSNTSMDPRIRRDFTSPSAVPPPLQPRGSPSPHRIADPQQASHRPPRKSSLSQQSQPPVYYQTDGSSEPTQTDVNDFALPQSSSRERSDSSSSKPLPFVRPADIYKRMQEEREKERLSQESSRPSVDGIAGKPSASSTGTPTNEQPDSGGRKPVSQQGNGSKTRSSNDFAHILKPALDPVKEKKSEHGFGGFALGPDPSSSQGQQYPKRKTEERVQVSRDDRPPRSTGLGAPSFLPELSRVSGFGESFFNTSNTNEELAETPSSEMQSKAEHLSPQSAHPTSVPNELQHQPSSGYRSVVHQAFDESEALNPRTPTSSAADSEVNRSASGGTSDVSPIISRGPSDATAPWYPHDNHARDTTPVPAHGDRTRPLSSSSAGTPKAVSGKRPTSQYDVDDLTNELPPSFIPGHRRNISTPSPDNSPARTPALEVNKQLQQPQEAELAVTTPKESGNQPFQDSKVNSTLRREFPPAINTRDEQKLSKELAQRSAESPGKSRVRDLAGKFESPPVSRRGSDQSIGQGKDQLKPNPSQQDVPDIYRPTNDRAESFRPQLPGGWESSLSITPATDRGVGAVDGGRKPSPAAKSDVPRLAESNSAQRESTQDPFKALSAAGAALTGAFASVTGMNNGNESEEEFPDGRARASSTNTAFHPEASKPLVPPNSEETPMSDEPTPVPNDHTKAPRPFSGANYFPPATPPKDRSLDIARPAEDTLPAKHSPKLPPLQTESPPQQYKSDRLRKEIMQNLQSPQTASDTTTVESDSPWQDDSRLSATTSAVQKARTHESTGIPSEYDSYWDESTSADELSRRNTGVESGPDEANVRATPPLNLNTGHQADIDTPESQPDAQRMRPPMPAHRFSWEKSSTDLSIPKEEYAAVTENETASNPPDVSAKRDLAGLDDANITTQSPVNVEKRFMDPIQPIETPETFEAAVPVHGEVLGSGQEQTEKRHPGGLEVAQPMPVPQYSDLGEDRSSPETLRHVESYTSSAPQAIEQSVPPLPSQSSAQPSGQGYDFASPAPAPLDQQLQKISPFRQILARKTPAERIHGFQDAREQFATLNTGLSHWLAVTVNDIPEHSGLVSQSGYLPTGVTGHKPSPSRNILGGLRPAGASSQPQPYYQQYLNASGQASDGSSGPPAGVSSQGASPSGGTGGKLSRQQVQAKGKDVLHSAGVFGGKTSVAAKGLLSKGRNKFRGASGTDKV